MPVSGGGDPIWMSGHRRRSLGRGGTWYFGDTPRSSSSAGGGRSMTVYSDSSGRRRRLGVRLRLTSLASDSG
jgi:hypothetical protein